jgi:hypothetical protein
LAVRRRASAWTTGWDRFVVADLGCRCVANEPWVTAAETAELAMACLTVGRVDQARSLIADLAPLAQGGEGFLDGLAV